MAKKKYKEPSYSDAEKCIELRKRTKQGYQLAPDDQKFVESMFRKYPEWYRNQNARIFKETAPFGSQ